MSSREKALAEEYFQKLYIRFNMMRTRPLRCRTNYLILSLINILVNIDLMTPLLKTFSALADETRMGIVEQLMAHGELPAGALVRDTSITAPAVSRHLKVLREAVLIAQRAEGTKRLYSARPESLALIADWTQSRRAFWDKSLDRLEAALREDMDPENFE